MWDSNVLIFSPRNNANQWARTDRLSSKVGATVVAIHEEHNLFWDRLDKPAEETAIRFFDILNRVGEVDFFSEWEVYWDYSLLLTQDPKTKETAEISAWQLVLLIEKTPTREIENYEQYVWDIFRGLGIKLKPHMTEGIPDFPLTLDKLDGYHPEKIINSEDSIYTVFLIGKDGSMVWDGSLGTFKKRNDITLFDLIVTSIISCKSMEDIGNVEISHFDGRITTMRTLIEPQVFIELMRRTLIRINPKYQNMDIILATKHYYNKYVLPKMDI